MGLELLLGVPKCAWLSKRRVLRGFEPPPGKTHNLNRFMLVCCMFVFEKSVFSSGFGHVWFFESCFADQGSETSYFTRFGAPLEKCKSKEGFGSGGSARWWSNKNTCFLEAFGVLEVIVRAKVI